MAYCLDTDTIIEFFRGNKKVVQQLKEKINTGVNLYLSSLSMCELFRGVYLSGNPEKERARIKTLLSVCRILPLTLNSCEKFGSISAQLIKEGKTIEDMDLLIGCVALSFGYTVVTNNKKHFERIPNLKIETWGR